MPSARSPPFGSWSGRGDPPADLAGTGTDRLQQGGGRGVRVGRDEEIDRGQGLVVHAPAVMQLVIERDLDHLGRRRTAERLQGAGEIDPVEAEDDVGLA